MRRCLPALLLALAACTQEAESVTTIPVSTTVPVATTTSPDPSTTEPGTTTTTLPPFRSLAYQLIDNIDFPIQMTAAPGSETSYLITKDGRVWLFEEGVVESSPVLDISGRVRNQGEQGLLSLTLHPNDPTRLFLHYSANNGDTVVAEYSFTDPHTVDRDSERILLRLSQPAGNHNGGMIQFGPDGSLYVGLGDGGGANDVFGNGQNPDSLLGGLVSLDVDGDDPDPTLYAMGLRNPWRFWLDQDLIYIADVGQNSFEEVSVARLEPGLNYGWPITEGFGCFRSRMCDTTGLVLPVVEVRHGDAGTCSITGGPVYRGSDIPELVGHYFYSDYCGGYLRSFRYDGGLNDETDWTDQVSVPGRVVGFGVDGRGEMYVATTESLLKVVAVRD